MMNGCASPSRIRTAVELAALSLIIGSGLAAAQTRNTPTNNMAGHAVEVQMRNVMYHYTENIAVHIRTLRGQVVPTKGELPVFDDKESFQLQIGSAEIAITPDSLANVLNSYVFAGSDAPLKNISIGVEDGGKLKIKGKLHSQGDISFETTGTPSATPDGRIRLHIEKVKALHLPVKGIMDLLGVKIADLIKTGKVEGVEVDKDDLILDPQQLLPAPHIAGPITAVRTEPGNIVQIIGHAGKARMMPVRATNYMAYRGNQIRFGKLTMTDTDLVLIDMDPKDPFDFYLDHYREQLVAGYTKETLNFGLQVFMRDYNKLRKSNTQQLHGSSVAP